MNHREYVRNMDRLELSNLERNLPVVEGDVESVRARIVFLKARIAEPEKKKSPVTLCEIPKP